MPGSSKRSVAKADPYPPGASSPISRPVVKTVKESEGTNDAGGLSAW